MILVIECKLNNSDYTQVKLIRDLGYSLFFGYDVKHHPPALVDGLPMFT